MQRTLISALFVCVAFLCICSVQIDGERERILSNLFTLNAPKKFWAKISVPWPIVRKALSQMFHCWRTVGSSLFCFSALIHNWHCHAKNLINLMRTTMTGTPVFVKWHERIVMARNCSFLNGLEIYNRSLDSRLNLGNANCKRNEFRWMTESRRQCRDDFSTT